MCNKYYNNNQYCHESPYKKIWGFPKKYKGFIGKVLKGIVIKKKLPRSVENLNSLHPL